MKRRVGRFVPGNRHVPVRKREKELHAPGFFDPGTDPVAIAYEQAVMDLSREIGMDDNRCIQRYGIVTFGKKDRMAKVPGVTTPGCRHTPCRKSVRETKISR